MDEIQEVLHLTDTRRYVDPFGALSAFKTVLVGLSCSVALLILQRFQAHDDYIEY